MTCLAAVVVFGVTYALVLPAITMTGKYPVLSAETLTAWTGDEIAVKVSAEADTMDGGRIVVLTLEGEGADLSASYAFNEEGVCVITDEEQKEIELHRAVREGTKNTVDYWFALEPGDQTVFTLNLADEVDVTRFAETMEAVRQSSDEAETEAEKASASDAGKSVAAAASTGNRNATASNADKASVSNADVAEANKIAAEKEEEKVVTESDDNGFVEILDGAIINDLDGEDEEDGEATEIITELKVSAGIAADYENAVKDAEKNADKRGDAQMKFQWKDVVVKKAAAPDLVAYVNGATIAVFCDEKSGIPADATLSVDEILEGTPEYEEYLAQTKSAVANATGSNAAKSVTHARFFDITILDAEGNELEPETPAKVVITYDESIKLENDGDLNVAHMKEDTPELLKPGTLEKSGGTDGGKDISGLSFTADSFSVYAVFGTETLTTKYLASNGDTYSITVTCPPESGIPSDAHLEVREIKEGEAEYEEYAARTAAAIPENNEGVKALRLFDITIVSAAGAELEPAAQVDVKIEYVAPVKVEDTQELSVVHFAGNDAQVILPDTNRSTAGMVDEITFRTESFSIYAVVTYAVTSDLAGKTFAIVHVNNSDTGTAFNHTTRYGRTLQNTAGSGTNSLASLNVTVETHVSGKYFANTSTDVTQWRFESAGEENKYYIKDSSGNYLNVGVGGLAVSDTAQALTVTKGTEDYGDRVRIKSDDGYYVQNSSSAANATATGSYYFQASTAGTDVNAYMALCEIQKVDPNQYPVYDGDKISVQDLQDGMLVMIYRSVFDNANGTYQDFVINGNGQLVRCYDNGDSINLHSEVSPLWHVTICKNSQGVPNGYYIFMNVDKNGDPTAETPIVLCPKSDGTLVADFESTTTSGVVLLGRENNQYASTIEKWDQSAMAYYGYYVNSTGAIVLESKVREDCQEFSFAKSQVLEPATLHPVNTVDSKSAGINIKLYDFGGASTSYRAYHTTIDTAHWIDTYTGTTTYTNMSTTPNMVGRVLADNGFPIFIKNNNTNAAALFSDAHYVGEANHLFLEDVYDSTGYYEYSAFNNYAYYNQSGDNAGDFTVYSETGAGWSSTNNFYHFRGQFFPFNKLHTERKLTQSNIYTGGGIMHDYENPNYGAVLYGAGTGVANNGTATAPSYPTTANPEPTNFFFGMIMDFNFMMPKDGVVNGDPMLYEFNGDDDLWIFVDDVLIMDIGGIHDAIPGSINFATGVVKTGSTNATNTNIKALFKAAGKFPDGTAWDDSKENEYFLGNTFVPFGNHSFKMFFMEHGAGCSNLMMRFNLPVIEKGQFTVEKALDNTTQTDYANVRFAYQAFMIDGSGHKIPVTAENNQPIYEGKTDPATGEPIPVPFYNDVFIAPVTGGGDPIEYDNVFYLKPTEAAIIRNVIEDELYYVQEIGVHPDYYDKITINGVEVDEQDVDPLNGIYPSTQATARQRARVTFTNKCDDRNSNELLIKKELKDGTVDNGDTFEFRVMMENANGELVPYNNGVYYLFKEDGSGNRIYYRYAGKIPVSNGQTKFAFHAGNRGTIGNVPPGFTVEIDALLADTDFYVDEIRVSSDHGDHAIKLSQSGWQLDSMVVVDEGEEGDGYHSDAPQITDATVWDYETEANVTRSATGRISLGHDSELIFTNKTDGKLRVKKAWNSGDLVTTHGTVHVALFTGSGDNLTLVPGSVKEITADTVGATVEYSVARPSEYTVREVTVDGDTVTIIAEGGRIEVTGEVTTIGNNKTGTYEAAYSSATASDAVREDTVTNSMYPLTLKKVDPNGNALQGAIFQLTDGQGAVVPGYESFESGEDGVLLNNAYLSNGTYYLEEIKAPDGFIKLPVKIAITVSDGEAVYTAISTDRTAPRTYENATDSDAAYEFVIDNNPGTELPSTGGPGTALYTLSGLMLLITSALLYGFRRRHEERRSA